MCIIIIDMSRGKDLASLFGATLVSLGTTMGPKLAVQTVYKTLFNKRLTSEEPYRYSVDDFPRLKRDRHHFFSDDGQILVGYMYYYQEQPQKGVVVMAHGFGGGGHLTYLDCANYIAKNGFYVFAYDATGNDESEGNSVRGLPQGVIDLDHVISFVEQQDEFKGLPIGLFGHSWGAYSVANALNEHPEVSCVVSVAGFSKSSDLLLAQGRQMVGPVIYVFIPYLKLIDDLKFGKYADETGMDGLSKTDAEVMIIHGGKDGTVPQDYGYDLYYEKYGSDPDYTFVYDPEAGHNNILNDDVRGQIIGFYDESM